MAKVGESTEWIALKERQPKLGQRVILLCRYGKRIGVTIGYRRNGWAGGFCTDRTGGGMAIELATHWLPFKAP